MKNKDCQKGFQLIEIVIATGILAIAFGAVIALSVSSSRGTKKNGELLLAISLAQITMEKNLCLPYSHIETQDWSRFHQNSSGGAGKEFMIFESGEYGVEQAITKDSLPDLYQQLNVLDYQYKIDVVSPLPGSYATKAITVTVRWTNSGNNFDYKLVGYRAKPI